MNRQEAIETLYQVINSGILSEEIEYGLAAIASTLTYHEEFEGNSVEMQWHLDDTQAMNE